MAGERRALVLGGTQFLGIHLVEGLLADGWSVTLFNRGVTQPDLFESLIRLRGDRAADVSALAGLEWDVVFDLSAFHPDQITRTAAHLADRCGHYVFVSTVSVYAGFREPCTTEDAPLARFEGPVPEDVDGASYGPFKALCERRVAELFASHTIVRPTVIAGPHDPSDRFTYWVLRLGAAGPHVVPPVLECPTRYVDARDLADWLVLLGSTRRSGIFNAAANPVPLADFLTTAADEAGTVLRPVRLTEEQITAEGVRPWLDLPMWLPPADETMRGFFAVDASRARAAGLRNRPLRETVRDTLAWARQRGDRELRVGLTPERESELVARYGNGDAR